MLKKWSAFRTLQKRGEVREKNSGRNKNESEKRWKAIAKNVMSELNCMKYDGPLLPLSPLIKYKRPIIRWQRHVRVRKQAILHSSRRICQVEIAPCHKKIKISTITTIRLIDPPHQPKNQQNFFVPSSVHSFNRFVLIFVHTKNIYSGDRQRLGSAIAAYLEYLNICASSIAHRNGFSNEDVRAQNAIARNWLDLDIFSMKRFLEDVIGPLRIPSHRRYLQYFSGLLSGKIKMNSMPLYLRFVTVESPPLWLHNEPISQQSAEWRSFIKIYEGINCVFTSGKWIFIAALLDWEGACEILPCGFFHVFFSDGVQIFMWYR